MTFNVGDVVLRPFKEEDQALNLSELVSVVTAVSDAGVETINFHSQSAVYAPDGLRLVSDFKKVLSSITVKGVELVEKGRHCDSK